MLHWPGMRILAVIVLAIFSILSVGCTADGVMLQPPLQGEWSNFHNDKHQVSTDARESAEKPPAEKSREPGPERDSGVPRRLLSCLPSMGGTLVLRSHALLERKTGGFGNPQCRFGPLHRRAAGLACGRPDCQRRAPCLLFARHKRGGSVPGSRRSETGLPRTAHAH